MREERVEKESRRKGVYAKEDAHISCQNQQQEGVHGAVAKRYHWNCSSVMMMGGTGEDAEVGVSEPD